MVEKVTPEEKLLKLIENPAVEMKEAKQKRNKFRFSFKAIFRLPFKKIASTKERFKPVFINLKIINQLLIIVCIILAVYLSYDLSANQPNIDKFLALALKVSEKHAPKDITSQISLLNLSEYLSEARKRDIFHFIPIKKEEQQVPKAKETLANLAKEIKLVGIIWSSKPQAMIEDKKQNKTILANPGDSMGGIKIKQILRDKVILGFEDQELELM